MSFCNYSVKGQNIADRHINNHTYLPTTNTSSHRWRDSLLRLMRHISQSLTEPAARRPCSLCRTHPGAAKRHTGRFPESRQKGLSRDRRRLETLRLTPGQVSPCWERKQTTPYGIRRYEHVWTLHVTDHTGAIKMELSCTFDRLKPSYTFTSRTKGHSKTVKRATIDHLPMHIVINAHASQVHVDMLHIEA